MPSQYLHRVDAIRRNQPTNDDVQRGMQIGQEVGKLLGGLSGAIKSAQKDALANRLMDEQSIGDQPGAGVTQDLGKLGDDGGDGSDSTLGDRIKQDQAAQYLGSLPADTSTFTNPSTGDVQPLQGQGGSDDQLSRAIAAAQLQGSGPTVGSAPSGGPQPSQTQAQSTVGGGNDFTLNPSDYSAGGTAFGAPQTGAGTVGGLIHTGGVQEMDLRKEMLATQLQKSAAARSAARDAQDAEDRPLEIAQKRAQLAEANQRIAAGQAKVAAGPKTPVVKNPPAENIASEPVIDQKQLVNHVDDQYGNGTFSKILAGVNDSDTAPVVKGDSVTFAAGDKTITVPLDEAQTLVKQQNALRLKQGLSAFRVPGEDQTLGTTANNPFPARNNLEVFSRAPAVNGVGGWVRLPNGKITQLIRRQDGTIVGTAPN
jgi:hypothetical protein